MISPESIYNSRNGSNFIIYIYTDKVVPAGDETAATDRLFFSEVKTFSVLLYKNLSWKLIPLIKFLFWIMIHFYSSSKIHLGLYFPFSQ